MPFLDHRLAAYDGEQRMVLGATTFGMFEQMLPTFGDDERDPWMDRMLRWPAGWPDHPTPCPHEWDHDRMVDTDLLKALVPVAAAAITGAIARFRVKSERDRVRADLDAALGQYERLSKLPDLQSDAARMAAIVHSYVTDLVVLEEDGVDRAWRRAVLWSGITGSVAMLTIAYLMLRRDGTWWTVGAIALAIWAVGVGVYGINDYRKELKKAEAKEDAIRSASSGTGPPKPESSGDPEP